MRHEALPPLFGQAVRRIHCVGVGGMGLGPLAVYLARRGWSVGGEDDALAPEMEAILREAGVCLGPIAQDCDLLVRSSAVPAQHPAVAAAAARGIRVVRRGEMLAEAVKGRRLVAVCGSHGKTTTTAMLVTAIRSAGFQAGYVCGGLFADDTPVAATGSTDWVVAEVDESDGTIDGFNPEVTVVVNLDWDHPDHYRSLGELEAAFAALCGRTRGAVLVSDACARSIRIAPGATTFGSSGAFRGTAGPETERGFTLALAGRFLPAQMQVRAHGGFNAANATAALAAAQLMGVRLAPGMLASYPGVRRRQTVLLDRGGYRVVEDYAHHPAEIRALLLSLRSSLRGGGRLIAVFQPHRHSRTAAFKSDFAASLELADSIHLLDVYAAGEAPVPGGATADVHALLLRSEGRRPVSYLAGDEAGFRRALEADAKPGDIVAFVGAGDINMAARRWVGDLEGKLGRAHSWDAFAGELRGRLSGASSVVREEPLAARTTLRLGGAARVYAEPADEADLGAMLGLAAARGIRVFALGRGSNLIVPDEGVDGLVVCLSGRGFSAFERLPDGRVRAGAGLRLKNLCGLCASAGLAGLEFLEGIPGSVGGALRMNAGAMGGWIFDIVDEVRLMRMDGTVATLGRAEMRVEYRACRDLLDAIALEAVLRPASVAASDAVSRQIDAYRAKRHETQPREPSAGCVFKNPPGSSAGRLIDESGLKGARVGGAEVSRVHANFMVNMGGATSADIVELVRRVRARVRQEKGIDLEPEVLLYGKEWKDVL